MILDNNLSSSNAPSLPGLYPAVSSLVQCHGLMGHWEESGDEPWCGAFFLSRAEKKVERWPVFCSMKPGEIKIEGLSPE